MAYIFVEDKGKIDEDQARRLFRQTIRALDYCKRKNICHRDLKPENILLDDKGHVKVSDFGLSSLHRDKSNYTQVLHTTCGTINYLAPEIIQNIGYDGHLADIWSCGVILYFMLAGFLPFEDDNVAVLLEKIVQGNVEFPKHFSKGAKDLLVNTINSNPKKRFTSDQIKEHPWFLEKMTEDEKKGFNEDLLKFSQEDDSKVAAFFHNFEENEIDDSSPKLIHPRRDAYVSCPVISPQSMQKATPLDPINPKRMDAFELSSFLSGTLINRICDLKISKMTRKKPTDDDGFSFEKSEQFTCNKTAEEIVGRVLSALEKTGSTNIQRVDPGKGYKIEASFKKGKDKLTIIFEFFELKPQLYLVNFSKGEGTLVEYMNLYPKFFHLIKDLVMTKQ